MGLFSKRPGELIDVAKFPTELEARVSYLEIAEALRKAKEAGSFVGGGLIFEPLFLLVGPGLEIVDGRRRTAGGRGSILKPREAEALRDWLLKEFPPEKPKKKGK